MSCFFVLIGAHLLPGSVFDAQCGVPRGRKYFVRPTQPQVGDKQYVLHGGRVEGDPLFRADIPYSCVASESRGCCIFNSIATHSRDGILESSTVRCPGGAESFSVEPCGRSPHPHHSHNAYICIVSKYCSPNDGKGHTSRCTT